ncbi:MAG: hypothetical protein KDB00_07655 [Planctomycetales bacterium]|nr:hypothetical protein [Planctomycetales bacterium]
MNCFRLIDGTAYRWHSVKRYIVILIVADDFTDALRLALAVPGVTTRSDEQDD